MASEHELCNSELPTRDGALSLFISALVVLADPPAHSPLLAGFRIPRVTFKPEEVPPPLVSLASVVETTRDSKSFPVPF